MLLDLRVSFRAISLKINVTSFETICFNAQFYQCSLDIILSLFHKFITKDLGLSRQGV